MKRASTGPCGGGTIGKAGAQAVQADGLVDLGQAGGMAGATTSGRASNDSLALRARRC
jgi:hypothetical protein